MSLSSASVEPSWWPAIFAQIHPPECHSCPPGGKVVRKANKPTLFRRFSVATIETVWHVKG